MACRGGRMVWGECWRWLRDIAIKKLRDPVAFWAKLQGLRTATGPLPHDALRALLPERQISYRVVRRVAGVGSLGRPRFVALAEWRGGGGAPPAQARVASPAAPGPGPGSQSTATEKDTPPIPTPQPL